MRSNQLLSRVAIATLALDSACTTAFGVTNLIRARQPADVSDFAYRVESRLHPIGWGIGPINAVGTDVDLSPSGPRCCSACTWTTRGPVPALDGIPQTVPGWEPQISASLVLRGQFALSALH